MSFTISKPPASPAMPPMLNSQTSAPATFQSSVVLPAASACTSTIVRNTAIGSLKPDSISSVALTRRLSASPRALKTENTAAASVEPTIAPSSMPCSQLNPNSHTAKAAITIAVAATPTVASTMPGPMPTRTVCACVRMPPSKRMMPSAIEPMR